MWVFFILAASQPHSNMLMDMYCLALYLLVFPRQLCLTIALDPHSGPLDILPKPNPLVLYFRDRYLEVLGPTSGDLLSHRASGTGA